MSGNVPFGLEMGEPEDVAPMVVFLLADAARHVTGQVYTANGGTIAVWNQPAEVRAMRKDTAAGPRRRSRPASTTSARSACRCSTASRRWRRPPPPAP